MKTQYCIALISIFLSHSSAFSLNDEVDESTNLSLSTKKILTNIRCDVREISPQSGFQIFSGDYEPSKNTSQNIKDTLPNIIVEDGVLIEKTSEGWKKYWISDSE